MALLRKRSATPDADTIEVDELADAGTAGKGRPTPKRSDARTGRSGTYKMPSDPKAARKQAAAVRRANANEMRQAMRSGDVSKMPARERAPERVLARQIVDTRHTAGPFFLIAAILYFLAPVTQTTAVIVACRYLLLLTLTAVVVDSFMISRTVTQRVKQEVTGQHASVRMYAIARALLPHRFRNPRPSVSAPPWPWQKQKKKKSS
jgi:hypothetical protein